MARPTLDELRAKIGAQTGPGGGKIRYADVPGTGPEGKTCGDCAFLRNTGNPGMKPHYKCGKTTYTAGDATTIKARTPACRLFEQFEEQR